MKAGAPKAEIDAVCALIRSEGLETFVSEGQERTIIGVVGIDIDRVAHVGTMPGVEQAIRVTSATQARQPRAPARSDADHGRRQGTHRRGQRRSSVMAGPCSVESRRAARRNGPTGQARGRAHPARRRVQAADVAIRVPGPGRGTGSSCSPRRARKTGLPIVTEMTDASQMESVRGTRRHHPDRQPQHAQLHAAARGRPGPNAGAAQARLRRDDRRVADGRRVRAVRRQRQRDPVRARHPDVRARHAQHARPVGRAGAARDDPPAGRRRSVARHGQALAGRRRWPWARPRLAPTD